MSPMSPIVIGRIALIGLIAQLSSSQLAADTLMRSRYLLLDDRLIDKTQNVRLAIGTVRKHAANPLMREDKPWEPRFDNLYPTIIYDKDQKLYRCWYNPFIMDPLASKIPHEKRDEIKYRPYDREFGVCYAVSEDGLKWTKPDLDLVEFNGNKANNILLRGSHGGGVLIDPRDPIAERRYKMFEGGIWIKKWQSRPAVRFSKDGLRWSEAVPCPEIEAHADTLNSSRWVPELKKYVTMTRIHRGKPFPRHPIGQRAVGRTESSDFLHWTKAVEVLRGKRESQTYTMPFFRYADIYLGLVMMIRLSEERVHCELAWSPDTLRWERINPGSPFIPNSPIHGDYDWGCVYAADAPIVTKDGIRIYYGGSNGRHAFWRDGFLCLATLRPDGWAGYEPVDPGQPGRVITKPIKWTGKLYLTADSAKGSVQVTVKDLRGKTLAESQPIKGDVTDQEVTFAKPAQVICSTAESICLTFDLHGAKLYSFAFKE